MKGLFFRIKMLFGYILYWPHLILFNTHPNKSVIQYEVLYWIKLTRKDYKKQMGLIYLLMNRKEFRNLFYKRIGRWSYFIKWVCPPLNSLYISTRDIGEGLYILHGFSTIIFAEKIGKNCHIYQQVTVGHTSFGHAPTIKDNVIISCGAKVLGDITIGNNVVIGANAVVVKNVPDNCTVVGVPAYIIKKEGIKVRENL
jgi:serine O-acetyltransferase